LGHGACPPPPNPQSPIPIPNPQSPIPNENIYFNLIKIYIKIKIILFLI